MMIFLGTIEISNVFVRNRAILVANVWFASFNEMRSLPSNSILGNIQQQCIEKRSDEEVASEDAQSNNQPMELLTRLECTARVISFPDKSAEDLSQQNEYRRKPN